MTSIGAHQKPALQAMQPSSPRLAVGQSVQVRVIGPTRHGLSVLVGKETFQLQAPSQLASAGTLTLQGTASAPTSGHSAFSLGQQVNIIAQDDRPLSKPIEGQLTPVVQGSKPSASTIVQTNVIKTAASPVSPEGKVLGPSVTLYIQVPAEDPAASTKSGQVSPVAGGRPASTTNTAHHVTSDTGRSTGTQGILAVQSEVSDTYDRGPESRIRMPVQDGWWAAPKKRFYVGLTLGFVGFDQRYA